MHNARTAAGSLGAAIMAGSRHARPGVFRPNTSEVHPQLSDSAFKIAAAEAKRARRNAKRAAAAAKVGG